MNPLGKRVLAVTLSLLFGLGAAEIALRLAPAATPFGDTKVPHGRTSSRLGNPGAKSADVVRVVVVGDSFTWGDGVHPLDSYAARLGRRFRALNRGKPRRPMESLNAGWNGRNTVKEAESLDRLLKLSPDLVILGFCLNDPEPSDPGELAALQEPLERRRPHGEVERLLYRRSTLVRTVYDRLENTRQQRAFGDHYADLYRDDSRYWRDCVAALRSMRDKLAARGIPFLVVVWPIFDSQLDQSYNYRELHAKLGRTLRELDVATVDLLPVFAGLDANRLAVTPFTDPHPSELAHRIAADHLAAYLTRCLKPTADRAGLRLRCPDEGVVASR